MSVKPSVYTSEFREASVNLANQSKQPIAQTARELGVKAKTLYTWMGKTVSSGNRMIRCSGKRLIH